MSRKCKVFTNLQVPPISASMLFELKQRLFYCEFLLLDEIGFDTSVKLPFRKIQKFVDSLELSQNCRTNFLRLAFGFATDFYKTSIPLFKKVSQISEACIFLAAKRFKIEIGLIPDDDIIAVLKYTLKVECTQIP